MGVRVVRIAFRGSRLRSQCLPHGERLPRRWLFSWDWLSRGGFRRRWWCVGNPAAAAVVTIAAAEAAVGRRGVGIGRRIAGRIAAMAAEDGEAGIGASAPHGHSNGGDQHGLNAIS